MASVMLHLLGAPYVAIEGVPQGTMRRKLLALLAYVSLTNRPYTRAELAAFLWPELDGPKGLAVLRSALWEAHQLLGDGWLETNRKLVQLGPGSADRVDALRFERLVAAAHVGRAASPALPDEERAARLMEATALYRGDFMQGFTLRDSGNFDDWQSLQTERLRGLMVRALEQLLLLHAAGRRLDLAVSCAQRMLSIDSLDESAHRHLMRLYAQGGQRSKALEQYATCRHLLAEQLGVPPQEDTRRLYEALKADTSPPPLPWGAARGAASEPRPASPAPRSGLPEPTGPLLGRGTELELIGQRLDASGCRLLTLTGPGGVGKTRLALEAAHRHVERHGTEALFVPLAGVGAPGMLAAALADALAVPEGPEPAEARLLHFLQPRRLLLVLDTLEHLLAGTPLLADLLERAPGLRLLATSRERLDLRCEWELALEGLPCAGGHAAVELFLQAATRADATFRLGPGDAELVARLCQSLGGLPLAIELAAAWVRHLPLREVAARAEQNLDFLAAPRDAPERQRSLRAAFTYSWNLLSAPEQQALRRLSIFRGGCTAVAASEVAAAPLPVLASLMRKCLVRRSSPERYELHELIRQYAEESRRAAPADDRLTRERHASWYSALLEAWAPALEGGDPRTALTALAPEMDNVRAAWSRAVEDDGLEVLQRALEGFCRVHALRGHRKEALAALKDASARVRRAPPEDATADRSARLLRGRLLAWQVHFGLEGAPLPEPAARIEESLDLLRELGEPRALRFALDVAGRLASAQGAHAAASWSFRGSLALSRELEDPRGVAQALNQLASVAVGQGHLDSARELLAQALGILRTLEDRRAAAACLGNLGDTLVRQGLLEQAERVYREGLRHLEEAGEPGRAVRLLANLVHVLCLRGDLAAAQRCCDELQEKARGLEQPEALASAHLGQGHLALRRGEASRAVEAFQRSHALYQGLGIRHGLIESLDGLGRAATARGDSEQAWGHFHAALALAMESGTPPRVLDILVGLAALPDSHHRAPRVRDALACIATHPAAEPDTRQRAARLLASGDSALRPPPGQPSPELSSLVSDVLGLPGLPPGQT